jgi:hypothetical protein
MSDDDKKAEEQETVQYKSRAEEMLGLAYDAIKSSPLELEKAQIAAQVGIGYSLLANGLDAEVFYALFHGPDDQATMNTWSSEV